MTWTWPLWLYVPVVTALLLLAFFLGFAFVMALSNRRSKIGPTLIIACMFLVSLGGLTQHPICPMPS